MAELNAKTEKVQGKWEVEREPLNFRAYAIGDGVDAGITLLLHAHRFTPKEGLRFAAKVAKALSQAKVTR